MNDLLGPEHKKVRPQCVYQPQSFKEKFEDKEQLKRLVEYCFEPGTAGNEKLKAVLADMLGAEEQGKKKGDKR
jgi:hypothetical protein